MLVTPKLIEQLRKMIDGSWWQVTTNFDTRFVSRPISASVANRLVRLGWAEKKTEWSADGKNYSVYCWITEEGKKQAVEPESRSR